MLKWRIVILLERSRQNLSIPPLISIKEALRVANDEINNLKVRVSVSVVFVYIWEDHDSVCSSCFRFF